VNGRGGVIVQTLRVKTMRVVAALSIATAAAVTLAADRLRAEPEARVIPITARKFEFTPREITLKQGETVKLQLRSDDVHHGFFVRPLGIDEEIVPGRTTEVVVTPKAAGRYTTICDHFCGAGHGNMKMTIVVE
jgi:cytochrome c oxidase subunit 2